MTPPTKCASCQGGDLFHGTGYPVYSNKVTLQRPAQTRAAVCLSCSAIQFYLRADQIGKVRKWKAEG